MTYSNCLAAPFPVTTWVIYIECNFTFTCTTLTTRQWRLERERKEEVRREEGKKTTHPSLVSPSSQTASLWCSLLTCQFAQWTSSMCRTNISPSPQNNKESHTCLQDCICSSLSRSLVCCLHWQRGSQEYSLHSLSIKRLLLQVQPAVRKQMNVNYKSIRVHKKDVNESRITGATNKYNNVY